LGTTRAGSSGGSGAYSRRSRMVGNAIRIPLLIAVMFSTSAYYNQGCSAPRASSRTISRQQANDYLRKGEKANLRAFRGGVEIDPVSGVPVKSLAARISSLTYYAGHGGAFSLAAPDRVAAKLLARFLKGHYVGGGGERLSSQRIMGSSSPACG
jgi:hypothetical protein